MQKLIEKAASILKKQNVEDFDIYGLESKGLSVEVKEGKVEKIRSSDKKGLALRVVVDGKLGFSYTSDVSDDGIRVAIECAKGNSMVASPDEYCFSMPSKAEELFPLADDRYELIPIEKKIELAKRLEARAFEHSKKIKRVRKASYSDVFSTVYYMNSNGHSFSYSATNFSLSILLVASEGEDSQMGWDFDSVRYFSDLNPDKVAVRAAESAVELLGARPIKTAKLPVVFKNSVFAELLEAFSPMFLGNNVLRGKSLFVDKLGRDVASRALTIYDDPTVRDGIGSMPFDDEGVPTRKKAIIERGVLRNYLLDIYSAKKLDMVSTGNGMRASLSSLPQPAVTNLVVERGALSFDGLVKTPEEVIVVTDAMGIHTINPISGEFSIGISGIYYKDGKEVQPVTGMTVAGNVQDLLFGITQVGSDERWLGNVLTPSVLVKELTVSGE